MGIFNKIIDDGEYDDGECEIEFEFKKVENAILNQL
jgi:hypothetical protein